MSSWTKLKVAELKAELKRRGLPQAGLKAELVARLEADDDQQDADPQQQAVNPEKHASQEVELQGAQTNHGAASAEPAASSSGMEVPDADKVGNNRLGSELEPASARGSDGALATARDLSAMCSKADGGGGREMHGVQEDPPHQRPPQAHDTPTAASTAAGSGKHDAPEDMEIETAADALKRKRRSASPTPNEEAVKRRRAQEMAHDAAIEPLVGASKGEDSSGEGNMPASPRVTSEGRRLQLSPVVATADSQHDAEPSFEQVGPSLHPNTSAIYINNLMRPMREIDLRTHLVGLATPPGVEPNHDGIVRFYVDSIRTHAFAVFDSASTAAHVRYRLHGRVWPQESNRKALFVDFVPADKVESWINTEADHARDKKTGFRWEVTYQPGRHGHHVEAILQSTSVTSSLSATHTASRAPATAVGIEGAPTGPRGYQHPPPAPQAHHAPHVPSDATGPEGSGRRPSFSQPQPSPDRYGEGFSERTMALPVLNFRPVPPAMAGRRLQNMRGFYTGDSSRLLGREINRYSFQDDDSFVDRGREVFEGIRPPHRQQALDRERGLDNSGGRGGARSAWPRWRGQAPPFRPRGDRYAPGPGGPDVEDRPGPRYGDDGRHPRY